MKKIYLFASLAALMATSCSDELELGKNNEAVPSGNCKITAYFPVGVESGETRTYLDAVGKYQWSPGDALGLFPATDATNTINAYFGYAKDQGDLGEFYGDVESIGTGGVYAYYPYAQDKELTVSDAKTTIEMTVSASQNFNFKANSQSEFSYTSAYGVGSFASGTAPAVAYGTITETKPGQYEVEGLKFQPVVKYLVFPIKGFSSTPITEVKLTVQDAAKNYYKLAGSFNVEVNENIGTNGVGNPGFVYGEAAEQVTSTSTVIKATDIANSVAEGFEITLNCGQGLPLDPETPINLWFVVPASLPVANMTFNLEIEGQTYDRTVGNVTRDANSILWVGASPSVDGKVVPFNYMQTNTYLIDTEYKFLEYCYLATAGQNWDYEAWNGLWTNYKQDQVTETFYDYTDLYNMVLGEEGKTFEKPADITQASDVVKLKNAIISNDLLNLAPQNIKETIGSATGVLTLPLYYQKVYGYYYGNGSENGVQGLNTIGSSASGNGYPYSISGKFGNQTATIQNLLINGNGIFAGNSTNGGNVSDIIFDSVTVNTSNSNISDSGSYFLTQASYVILNTITVNNTCSITPKLLEKAEGENPAKYSDCAIFGSIMSSNFFVFQNSNWKNIKNLTNYAYLNNLIINNDFYFTKVIGSFAPGTFQENVQSGIDVFNNISVLKSGANQWIEGPYALTVSSVQEATNLMIKVDNAKSEESPYGENPYSVVTRNDDDEITTSFWTGTTYAPNGSSPFTVKYAEELAYMAHRNSVEVANLQNDINLMGYPWYSTKTGKFTVNGGGATISQINITDQASYFEDMDAESSQNLTLFGATSSVKKLTLKNVTITNKKFKNAQAATLSVIPSPSGTTTGVTIDGLTIDVLEGCSVGGFYVSIASGQSSSGIQNGQWSNLSDLNLVSEPVGISSGYLANTVSAVYSTNSNIVLTNPIVSTGTQYPYSGKLVNTMTVNLASGVTDNVYLYLNGVVNSLNDLTPSFIKYTNSTTNPKLMVLPFVNGEQGTWQNTTATN